MCPMAQADGHDAPGLVGEPVPSGAAMVEDVLDHCCDAWKRLTDQPWTIMSIGLRKWAHKF